MHRMRAALVRLLAASLLGVAAACLALSAPAQPLDQPALRPLTSVLKRIKENRVVRLGVREAAVPFAAMNAAGQASGYSVDLCLAIVSGIEAAIGSGALRVEYRKVTTTDRLEQVADGRVELECGATTNTAERRRVVAFSPPIFIAGTRLLVRRGSPVRSIDDLAGRRVAVVRGTTNEAAMQQWAGDPRRRLQIVTADNYEDALAQVGAGDVAALAADDALLAGYVASPERRRQYAVVGGLLSYEPYGIVFSKDDAALAEIVHATFARLATSGEIRSIYARWFLRPLPSGVQLSWPMSPQLVRAFEMLGMPTD
jgi:glutamate/aspartate transport system substrate-binding protein